MSAEPYSEWSKKIAPIAAKFKVASMIEGGSATWNQVGSAAMYALMTEMARRLDIACQRESATPPDTQIEENARKAVE